MELYINRNWTERYANTYVAEAIVWSEEGNHATIFARGITADEANAKLEGALRELLLIPEAPTTKDGDGSKESRSG
jgi:hypothetical protein